MKSLLESIDFISITNQPVRYIETRTHLYDWTIFSYQLEGTDSVIIRHLAHRQYTLCKVHGDISNTYSMILHSKIPTAGLFFLDGKTLRYKPEQEDKTYALKSDHYNFICIRTFDGIVELNPTSHLLIINFSLDYLKQWQDGFPSLAKAASWYESGSHSYLRIFAEDIGIDHRISSILKVICESTDVGSRKIMFIDTKVQELLLHCSQHHSGDPVPRGLKTADIRKLHEAREFLGKNLSTNISLKSVAQHVGINTFKLKTGFKDIYGTTVFQFLREVRMTHGHHLIETTELTIEEISFECGYKNLPNFTNAFKRKYGYPPSYLRRKGL